MIARLKRNLSAAAHLAAFLAALACAIVAEWFRRLEHAVCPACHGTGAMDGTATWLCVYCGGEGC